MSKKKVLLKIIFLGDSGVGKTAILHKYVDGEFIEDHKATIGADFLTKEIEPTEDKKVTLQIWDTAGQERFQSLGTAFFRGADCCVLVYDVTNNQSFTQIESWRSSFLDQSSPEDSQNFPFLLLGNKCDLSNGLRRQVETSAGEKLAKQYNMTFYETSALEGTNITTAMEVIAKIACNRPNVPFFSEEIANKLTSQDLENNNTPDDNAPCACNLL